MDVFHYVHFDGSSDDFEGTMIYHRHHRKDIPHHIHHVQVGRHVHSHKPPEKYDKFL
jgi:hypothetical protein